MGALLACGPVSGAEESITDRVRMVRERIAAAVKRSGRDDHSVGLVAVTKQVAPEHIREAVTAGITVIGENYVQEARRKRELLEDLPVEWRLIGRLQSNKARLASKLFDMVESVDRLELAVTLARIAAESQSSLPVLVQVSLGKSENRSGIEADQVPALIEKILELDHLDLKGLMGVALPSEPEEVRAGFRLLRKLWDDIGRQMEKGSAQAGWDTLSMGMSQDFEIAIEEGATSVRIGSAIFGARTT